MTARPSRDVPQDTKISILLHEYDTLRAELIQRHSALLQAIGVFAAVLVGLTVVLFTKVPFTLFDSLFNTLVIGVLIAIPSEVFFLTVLAINHDVERAARRVREIETAVNDLVGEKLLKWESKSGYGGHMIRQLLLSRAQRRSN